MTLYDEQISYDYSILYDGAGGIIALTLTETISLFESLLTARGVSITLTDSITLTELLTTAQSLVVRINEMLNMTDSLSTITDI